MVNAGKPSRACATCKARRIKCDLTRPICNRCRLSGRECPGALDESEVSFVNQTTIVTLRARNSSPRTAEDSDEQDSQETLRILSRIAQSYRQMEWLREDGLIPKPPALSKELVISKESQAVILFFEHFVASPAGSKFMNPSLEWLPELYPFASPSEPLSHMVTAIALVVLSNYPGFQEAKLRAATSYMKALRSLSSALQDEGKARSNATLMAIMLAFLYETMVSTSESLQGYDQHLQGASNLLLLRSDEQQQDEGTRKLLRIVHSELILEGLPRQQAKADDHHFQSFSVFDNPFNPVDQLFEIAAGLPGLLKHAETILNPLNGVIEHSPTHQILVAAEHYESRLLDWFGELPPDYNYSSIPVLDSIADSDPEVVLCWPGLVHKYTDLFIARVLNNYRILRIHIALLIMRCAWRISAETQAGSESSSPAVDDGVTTYHVTFYTLSSMVDDICASVPYHLGLPPAASSDYFGMRTKMSTAALGGYFLIRPLRTALEVDCIPLQQARWIRGRLKFISHFGFGQARILSMRDAQDDMIVSEPTSSPVSEEGLGDSPINW